MRRWRLAWILVALAFAPWPLAAQGQAGAAAPDPATLLVALQAQLGLSPDQVARINRIGEDFRRRNATEMAALQKEMEQIRQKYGQPPYAPEVRSRIFREMGQVSARHSALSRNSQKAQEDVIAVLSPEQRQRLQQLTAGRLGGPPPAAGRPGNSPR